MAREPARAAEAAPTRAPATPADQAPSSVTPVTGTLVLGTAGHVDHGKTTLVGALTGMQTDRLPEERARGISIELGFAWLDLPEGARVAIVDVPGHERFVRQMIGGAAGIDAVMLVVAADEGVMPQTREHLAICRLLGVRTGFVVLTRTDLVTPDFLELAIDDVSELVRGTFLEGRPILPFSALDPGPSGRDAIVAAISTLAEEARRARPRDAMLDRPLLFSIDRAFSLHGHGTIATGTSTSGRLEVGAELLVFPGARPVKVRGLEVHGRPVDAAGPGLRVAVNLTGVMPDGLPRGARLVAANGLAPTSMIDGTFEALAALPVAIPQREKALVCFGTAQVEATLTLLDRDELAPGASATAQLRLGHPLPILPGERFIVRGFRDLGALGATLGGGLAIAPAPRKRRLRGDAASFEAWIGAGPADPLGAIVAYLHELGEHGLERAALATILAFPARVMNRAVEAGAAKGMVLATAERLYASSALVHLREAITARLTDYHAQFPTRSGLRLDELRTRVRPEAPAELFAAVVDGLARDKLVRVDQGEARLATHKGGATPAQRALREKLGAAFELADLAPPRLDELAPALGVTLPVLEEEVRALVAEGRLVRVTKELIFARAPLEGLEGRVRAFFATHELLDAQALKELTGASRKFSIPLGEWLDRSKLTVRVGEARRLRSAR